jgi:glycosyltransferase involved in cell wall biosynthesis
MNKSKTPISVILITFNEESKIRRTIEAVSSLTDDIIVIDSFSTDKTPEICTELGVTFIQQAWQGYGKQKNAGHAYATYDWILSIDADEVVSTELLTELKNLQPHSEKQVFNIPFKTFFCNTLIRFGGWNPQFHIRLFNKKYVHWDTLAVHETLDLPKDIEIVTLDGFIQHYSYDSIQDYNRKSESYTDLFAIRLKERGKKTSWNKLHVSPVFTFIKEYIFKLGFLDGAMGFKIACLNYNYTKQKYHKLQLLLKK